jgi:hypothetical protein
LRSLQLPANDYAIFGSGPLVVRGVIETANDLDVLCRGAAWEAVCTLAPPKWDPKWSVELVSLYDDRLTFGTRWAIGEVDVDELIDSAEMIEGLPFARLAYVIEYKKRSARPKDIEHLEALGRFESRCGFPRR